MYKAGFGLAEIWRQVTHPRVMEQSSFRHPMMWNLWQRDEMRCVGPTWSRCWCSVWIIILETKCFPWRMTGCCWEWWRLECCSLPPTRRISNESRKGFKGKRWLVWDIECWDLRAAISCANESSWDKEIQYFSANIISLTARCPHFLVFLCRQLLMKRSIQAVIRFKHKYPWVGTGTLRSHDEDVETEDELRRVLNEG